MAGRIPVEPFQLVGEVKGPPQSCLPGKVPLVALTVLRPFGSQALIVLLVWKW